MTFHSARLDRSASLSHASWSPPMRALPGPRVGLAIGRVRPPVAPQVQHEDLEQRPVGKVPVDALPFVGMPPHRHELEQCLAGTGCKERRALHRVAIIAVELQPREPVVHDLVVVPLGDHGHRRVEAARVVVEEVVREVAPEFVERLGDLCLGVGDKVPPDRSVVEDHLGDQRLVGVDHVAGVDEHVRLGPPQGLEHPDAPAVDVDAPSLSDGVARERDPDRSQPSTLRAGSRTEAPRLRRAPRAREIEALEADPVHDLFARGQVAQVGGGGVVPLGEGGRTAHRAGVLEPVVGRPVHP